MTTKYRTMREYESQIYSLEQRMSTLNARITALEDKGDLSEAEQSELGALQELFNDSRQKRDTLKAEKREQLRINESSSISDPSTVSIDQRAYNRAYGISGGSREPGTRQSHNGNPARWVDSATGEPLQLFGAGDSVTDFVAQSADVDPAELSIGKYLIGLARGDMSHCRMEAVAMGGETGAGGGFVIPSVLSSRIIDAARAQSVVLRMGAQVLAMPARELSVARVDKDPTFETKAENAEFSGSEIEFDLITLKARTIGNVVTISREMAADAINGARIVEQVLSSALAVELDRLAIQGSGAAEPIGLLNLEDDANELTGINAIHWDDILDAIEQVESQNFSPNGYIVSPRRKRDLAKLKTGDGTNSAAMYLSAPPDVAALQRGVTTSMPVENAIVGDFARAIWAIRQTPMLEVSGQAGDAFKRHQLKLKLVWRGDFLAERGNGFSVLRGITDP